MIGRDTYIKMLEKRASDFDGGKTGPTYDHDVDSAAVANSEVKSNVADTRGTLGSLFSNFGQAQRKETEFAKKWSPTPKPEESASPLIKVAMAALSQSSAFQEYPLHYKMAAIRGFTNELEKISFAISEKGHKFDAEKYRLLARQHAEHAEHLQKPEYNALGTVEGFGDTGGAVRFGYGHDRPDALARHAEYAAKKHEEGKNAYNPWGGLLTPSSYEHGATHGLGGKYGKTRVSKSA